MEKNVLYFLSWTATVGMLLFGANVSIHAQEFRTERDLLGPIQVPSGAFYGVQTVRAQDNFPISQMMILNYPQYIKALALVKKAAAETNHDLGVLPSDIHQAILKACDEVLTGKYNDQFSVNMYQGGAGTSTNMVINEVVANIANFQAGKALGKYEWVTPNDHVNMSQSTNDFIPTSIKVALLMMSKDMKVELKALRNAFFDLGQKHIDNLKMGRTEYQDAVPMTSGQEFHSFAAALEWEYGNIEAAEKSLMVINMGATAIGTQINAPMDFSPTCAKHLSEITGFDFVPANDLIAGTWNLHPFVVYSSALKSLAITLTKISRDLMFLSSGPRNGIYELKLPERQPGSSIMPGKVNPVMPEVLHQVCFRVIANDLAVTLSAENGMLQLNAYEPLVASATFESQELFTNVFKVFREKCVEGIIVNSNITQQHINTTVGIVTSLVPVIGYKKSSEIAAEAYHSGKGVLEVIREKKILTEKEIKKLLDPVTMTNLRKENYKK